MTILQRLWRATEVDREGFKEWVTSIGVGLLPLGIVLLVIVTILCWFFAAKGLFNGVIGLFH